MSKYTNTLVNLSYLFGIAILILGLVDRKMRLMDVSDAQWVILSLVLGIFFFSNYFFGSSPKNFKSPAGHSFKQVSNCVAFYREVFKSTGTLAKKNKEYVNAHMEYMDFQEKVLKKVLSKYQNMNLNEILQSVENSNEFNQYEKDSIDGFVDAKLSYANSSSQDNSMKKFFCIIPD